MNMNIDLVNRALYATGHGELIKEEDKGNKEKPLYDLCKAFYLSTYLEALNEVPWVSARRRKKLMIVRRPRFNSGYKFVYTLPYDCARPIELSNGKDDYIIEGNYLCTDEPRAELLYITNGRILPEMDAAEPPAPGEDADLILSPGEVDEFDHLPIDEVLDPGELPDDDEEDEEEPEESGEPEESNEEETDESESEEDINEDEPAGELPEDIEPSEDYPEFRSLRLEPKFYEFLEKMLAAKFATKISDKPQLHNMLLQEAMYIKQEAIFSTKSMAKARKQPSKLWQDILGKGEVV